MGFLLISILEYNDLNLIDIESESKRVSIRLKPILCLVS